jgi:hypothetical protein
VSGGDAVDGLSGRLCRTWPGRVCRLALIYIVKSLLITDLYIFLEIVTVARPLQTHSRTAAQNGQLFSKTQQNART